MGNKIRRFLCSQNISNEEGHSSFTTGGPSPPVVENEFTDEGGNDTEGVVTNEFTDEGGNDTEGVVKHEFTDEDRNDTEGVINEISQILDHIREGEPATGQDRQWPDHLSALKKFLKTTQNENDSRALQTFQQALDGVQPILDKIGNASLVTAGFHVISYGLKKVRDVYNNNQECLSMLEEMIFLNKIVKQCTERKTLKEGMKEEITNATKLIMKGTLTCLAQIESSPFSKLWNTDGYEKNLNKIGDDIKKKKEAIYLKLNICIIDGPEDPRLSREYPKHAVGIEKSRDEVTDLLELATPKKAVAVILYGFGGMGKSTVADAVFHGVKIKDVDGEECKYSHVELFNSIESTPDIVKLQKKILEDLMGRKNIPEIRKYQDGQEQIRITLEKVPAFIYIDNVLEKDKLRQLLPLNFDTARKVRLLITSRDRNVRKACRMETPPKEYRIRGISSRDARHLLKKQMPRDALDERSDHCILDESSVHRIIDRCGGIPLMLNLVVQELSSAKLSSAKYKTEVHEVIQELEKLEGEEFGAKLDSYFFHYDRLPQVCKEPFLDICSSFIGWDWDTVADIVGKTALDRLEHRSLVAKGKDGAVTVPDVIMKVGQRKAEEMRMRFTATSQLMNFLRDDEKVEQLRYLTYKPAKDWNQLKRNNLKMPQNLKFMEIDGKLHCDDLEIFPTRILRLQELRILRLFNFQGLKELPSVLGHLVKGLRELTLSNCKSIEELPYSISMLRSLRVLKMDYCQNLRHLPDDFVSLNSLEILNINRCDSLKDLPHKFEGLSSLRVLNLFSCTALEHLPDGLGRITSLVKLNVPNCKKLKRIPESIQDSKSLLSMDISWCSSLEQLPNEFCPPSITYLKLTNCTALKNLPDEFGRSKDLSLRVLKLKSCTQLHKLPVDFSNLKCMEHLDLSGCTELEELCESFSGLLSLTTLSLDGCTKLKKLPPNFRFPYSLQHLNLSNCEMLEGESMNSLVETKALQMVYIKNSRMLKEKWGEMQEERKQWSFTVDIGQDLSEEEKENEWEARSSELLRILQNRQGEPFQLSLISPDTNLLVMFDGCFDFNQDFPWPLIGDTIGDIQEKFEIIYIGKHFNKLPKAVADRISGRALDNTVARLLLERAFSTLQVNGKNLWHQKMNKFFSISTEVRNKRQTVGTAEENGGKYLSCWKLLSDCQLEEFVLEKCGRYVWLKQLAAKRQESNIQLLRELFVNGGEDNSLAKDSGEVGLDELRKETILLEIRPAGASYDVRLQSLKNMYNNTEKERPNIEIISVPVGPLTTKMKQFLGDIPWLVLQNSWTLSRTEKYFLIKSCKWEEKDGELSESWYSSRFVKIQVNEKVTSVPVLSMLERWGPRAYPFSDEKIEELKDEEWNERKRMSSLEFLFKPLMGEPDEVNEVREVNHELREVIRQRKMICLLCDGNHPRTKRVRTQTFLNCIKDAMKDLMDEIHFIYVPHYEENNKEMLTVTDSFEIPYFPMVEDSKKPKLQHLLTLEHWAAMRFWMRVGDLRKEIEGMDENDKKLQGLKILLESLHRTCLSMAVMDREGEVLTTKGRQIADIFDRGNNEAKGLTADKAKKLVGDMINGSKEEREAAALELESRLF